MFLTSLPRSVLLLAAVVMPSLLVADTATAQTSTAQVPSGETSTPLPAPPQLIPPGYNPGEMLQDLANPVVAEVEGHPITLAEIKAKKLFADSPLVRQGRLSVVPLTAAQYTAIAGK